MALWHVFIVAPHISDCLLSSNCCSRIITSQKKKKKNDGLFGH